MLTHSLLSVGYQGVQSGLRLAQSAASEMANAGVADATMSDISSAVVSLNQADLQVQAALKVTERANDMMGTLLDITV